MSEENKAIVQRWFEEVWNQGREETITELFDPNGRSMGFPEPQSIIQGPEEFKKNVRLFRGAFPDVHVVVDEVLAEGDRVAVRWTVTMTHLGDHLGFSPSGKRVSMGGSSFLRCAGGRILEGWNQMDFTKVSQELQAP
jgi:predicted ester cyclase